MLNKEIVALAAYTLFAVLVVLGMRGAWKLLLVHTQYTVDKNKAFLLAAAEGAITTQAVATAQPEEVVEVPAGMAASEAT